MNPTEKLLNFTKKKSKPMLMLRATWTSGWNRRMTVIWNNRHTFLRPSRAEEHGGEWKVGLTFLQLLPGHPISLWAWYWGKDVITLRITFYSLWMSLRTKQIFFFFQLKESFYGEQKRNLIISFFLFSVWFLSKRLWPYFAWYYTDNILTHPLHSFPIRHIHFLKRWCKACQ